MVVKRISPKELPSNLIFTLNHLYKTELGEFVAMPDQKRGILFVNRSVPQEDADRFLEVIQFPYYWVNDCETGMGEFTDYVFNQYGSGVYRALMDSHQWHMEQMEKARAEEAAKAIIPLIEKELGSETPVVEYDEYLAYKIWEHGFKSKRKTPRNMTCYGSVYEFYFGYLMGAGMLEGIAVQDGQ